MKTFHVRVTDSGKGIRQVSIVEDLSGESADIDQLRTYILGVAPTVYSRDEVKYLLDVLEKKREEARSEF